MSDEERFQDDPKFPGQAQTGLAPFPTAENPGRVFPKTDPNVSIPRPKSSDLSPDRFIGNPYLMNDALNKVDHAFGEVIALLEEEEGAQNEVTEDALVERFKTWRKELNNIRSGKVVNPFPNKYRESSSNHAEGIFKD